MMQFVPKKDFFSPDLMSQYCAGMTYTVRPNNQLLTRLSREWLAQGLIEMRDVVTVVNPTAAPAVVTGAAKVSEPAAAKPTLMERMKSWL